MPSYTVQWIIVLQGIAVQLPVTRSHYSNHSGLLQIHTEKWIAVSGVVYDNFHLPSSNLSLYQKGVYFTGIKVYNSLPKSIKNLSNDTKQFKSELKNYLHAHIFYSIDE
jgi:hypothetical protein